MFTGLIFWLFFEPSPSSRLVSSSSVLLLLMGMLGTANLHAARGRHQLLTSDGQVHALWRKELVFIGPKCCCWVCRCFSLTCWSYIVEALDECTNGGWGLESVWWTVKISELLWGCLTISSYQDCRCWDLFCRRHFNQQKVTFRYAVGEKIGARDRQKNF